MQTRARGFTFIEVLVVMGIIAILAGLTVVAMNLIIRRGPEFNTDTRIKKIAGVVNSWKARFERYPPTEPEKLSKVAGGDALPSMPNQLNVPIETLYQALYWPTSGIDPQLGDDEIGNTDEDEFEKATAQGKKLYEVLDAWGSPLVYFVHTDYARADADPPAYVNAAGEEVTPRPWKYSDESRGFAEPRGIQVFSMGEDLQPNTADDRKSWE